jgi:uncharacterized membrane-anchored protein
MPNEIQPLAALPILAGLLYLLAIVRMWRTRRGLAVVMLVFPPAVLYALVRHWHDRRNNIRVPTFGAMAALALWSGLIVAGVGAAPGTRDGSARGESPHDALVADAHGRVDGRKLRLAVALANLPYRSGHVELARVHALIDVPAHFHFIAGRDLQTLYAGTDSDRGQNTVGWLVHESVNLAAADAWFVKIEWMGDGFIAENDLAVYAHQALLADAQHATAQRSGLQGQGATGFSLIRYAEPPAFDAAHHGVTWVEELAYANQNKHRLDCYAAKLGRGGALVYSMSAIGMQRQELCLRAVRLAATRTEFASGHAYTDHWGLFDRYADYDVVELITGVAALQR